MNGFDELLKQLFPQQKPVYQPTAANQLTAPKPQAEVTAYEPTLRQRGQQAVQGLLENIGYDRGYSRGVSQSLLGGPSSTLPMDMGLADIVPGLGYLLGAEDSIEGVKSAKKNLDEGNIGSAALEYGLSGLGLLPGIAGMHAYHGTPHDIKGGFDLSKVGTGEGAQVYGHGIYFGEAKGTGEQYAKLLANRDVANQGRLNAHANAQRLVNLSGDPKYAADDIKFVLESNPDSPQKSLLEKTLKYIESGEYAKPLENKGNLYKVDIPDEQIPKMLNWDEPLNKQPKAVKEAFNKLGIAVDEKANKAFLDDLEASLTGGTVTGAKEVPNPTGESLYNNLVSKFGSDVKASEALNKLGVTGIRYLDEGSRAAGKGTSNFVVFDPKTVKILEKNDMPYQQAGLLNDTIDAPLSAPNLEGGLLGVEALPTNDYKGSHVAPNANSYGATLDDLTKIMPANVYTREGKNLYGLGDDAIDRDWWMTAMKAKGKPDFEVEVYRAVPKGVKNINSGDWVTTSKKYAENHGESALSGDYEIISKKVKAKTLSTAGDPQEYGYNEEDITNLFKD